ncbi:response regulator [Rhizobium paknamense]|uniref:DNA-binding response OmpR family regulator n=1 Tax=Rhizobium paknamense TaxID=1206817 RepID=A0ABU0IF98_9HYPH|nr:response regulator [Rhizobium paknamense]MDQ0456900.1 DNA-binding response OmpR family regulator [Rhizobium paknamense]
MQPEPETVLIVEDDAFISMDAAESVARAGANVVTTETVSDALDCLEANRITAAILDFQVLDGNVAPVVERLKRAGIPYRVVSGSPVHEITARGIPADRIVPKPADYLKVMVQLVKDRPWSALRANH